MINKNGYPTLDQIKSKFPEPKALVKPKAIIECYTEIPCNPCSTSCPFDAITIGEDINKIPEIDFDVCTGCGMCVYSCPGLAIMVANIKEDRAYYKIPYELIPVPVTGEIWKGVNRKGEIICEAKIENVMQNKNTDRTILLTVSTPIEFLYDFITIRCTL
ncbi:4Fe-4S binding protein [Mycoplasmatota bacterium WC30]